MISVVLATRNEADNIERCLRAVKSWVDEIIVVDGDSTDQTRELAKKLGAKVYQTSHKANFHINKQMAMDKAKGQLVLQLDADEVVDQQLKKFIMETHEQVVKLKAQDLKNYQQPVAWWIKRKNFFLGKWLRKTGQYPDPVIRLYINGKARLPQKDVHEQMEVQGQVGWANGHLLHYSNPTLKAYLTKFETYTTFKAHQLWEAEVSFNVLTAANYLFLKPLTTWFSLFIRHKGFMDGARGFLFALLSGLHHPITYLKLWELKHA